MVYCGRWAGATVRTMMYSTHATINELTIMYSNLEYSILRAATRAVTKGWRVHADDDDLAVLAAGGVREVAVGKIIS